MTDDSIKGGQTTEMTHCWAAYKGCVEESREHHSQTIACELGCEWAWNVFTLYVPCSQAA